MLNIGKSIWLRLALLCVLILSLTACIEVKQSISINKDGSGDAKLEVAVQQEWASQIIPKLKSDLPKGWALLEEKQKDGKQVVVIGRQFKHIAELNDNELRYSFSIGRKGFLKKSFNLEVRQLKSSGGPFPYKISIIMPGSINETNGDKVATNTAMWNLQGFRRGTVLSVKSNAFAVPDLASLKESFMSAGITKKILLALIVLIGILLFFGVALLAKKTIRTRVAKPSSKNTIEGIYCTECGTPNPKYASFCKKCGKKIE